MAETTIISRLNRALFDRRNSIQKNVPSSAAVGCQRSVSQPQSVLGLTPDSNAICFLVFRNFNRFCFIF